MKRKGNTIEAVGGADESSTPTIIVERILCFIFFCYVSGGGEYSAAEFNRLMYLKSKL